MFQVGECVVAVVGGGDVGTAETDAGAARRREQQVLGVIPAARVLDVTIHDSCLTGRVSGEEVVLLASRAPAGRS